VAVAVGLPVESTEPAPACIAFEVGAGAGDRPATCRCEADVDRR